MKEIKVQNKNSQKTCYQLSTSIVVDKWVKEATKQKKLLKSLKIQINPSTYQRQILDEWINTSNYVYNKTVEKINNGHAINFQSLRDILVTKMTKKNNHEYKTITENLKLIAKEKAMIYKKIKQCDESRIKELQDELLSKEMLIKIEKDKLKTAIKILQSEENKNIKTWEYNTPKEIRAGAVNDVCKAYKTGFSNLKAGNIKYFRLGYRKHLNTVKTALIPANFIKNINGNIKIAPTFLKNDYLFKMGKKTLKKYKDLEINNDCRISKHKNNYFLFIPLETEIMDKEIPLNYCGIDPGERTFMTTFGNNNPKEYCHNRTLLKKLNRKLDMLKALRSKPKKENQRNKYRKRHLNKLEKKKSNLIDELHWKTINDLLKCNDILFYGDIKSHNIVKHKQNKTLNRSISDLKLYKFKIRLLYKASVVNKKVFVINESFTTQTCSKCGYLWKAIGNSEIYKCSRCKMICGRDINASKNILMKGIVTCL
jgi:putative transposase